MSTEPLEARRLRRLETFTGLYLLVVVGRLIYEGVTTRGLYGWLATEQMQRLGHFNLKLTLIAAAVVYLLPVFFVTNRIKRTRAQLTEAGLLTPKGNDAMREAVATARLFIVLGLGFALAGGIAYYVMAQQNAANAQRRVEAYPLEVVEALPAEDAAKLRFVEVSATCQTRAGYRWTESDTRHLTPDVHYRYLPLTHADWRQGQPVRFFLQTTVDVYYPPNDNGQPFLPRSYEDAPFAGSFEGELKRETLPLFASTALQRAGITIATPYYVLEQRTLRGQAPIIPRQTMLLAPLLGGFVGLVFLLTGLFMYWRRAGYAARIAARRARQVRG